MKARTHLVALGVAVVLALGTAPAQAAQPAPDVDSSVSTGEETHRDPLGIPDPSDPEAALERDAPTSVPPAPCEGDGRSGQRVHVMYGYPKGTPNRIDKKVDAIRRRVALTDLYLSRSGSRAGSQHVRWLCRNRSVQVTAVEMMPIGPDGTFTLEDMRRSLREQTDRNLGPVDHSDRERIYLVFMDHILREGAFEHKGQAYLQRDTNPDPRKNLSNTRAGYAMVAQWGGETALAEFGHSLGAVQNSAPHSSGSGHCYEENDVMCYEDGGSYFKRGGAIKVNCPDAPSWTFDCGKDDYYDPKPRRGSYLDKNWNTSRSGWLTKVRR